MSDDLVKMCKRLSKYAHAQLSSRDLERIAKRIEKLEAMMKWGDEISNIQAARIEELEAKLAKAVKAIKLALEAINGLVDSGDAFDSVCAILAELKGNAHGED